MRQVEKVEKRSNTTGTEWYRFHRFHHRIEFKLRTRCATQRSYPTPAHGRHRIASRTSEHVSRKEKIKTRVTEGVKTKDSSATVPTYGRSTQRGLIIALSMTDGRRRRQSQSTAGQCEGPANSKAKLSG